MRASFLLFLAACGDDPKPQDSGGAPADDTAEPANTAPTCALTAPAAGAVELPGVAVLLEATVDDAEEGPSTLAVQWESDLDGVVGAGTGLSGTAAADWESPSIGEHTLTLTVTDGVGEICTDNAVFIVDTPPSIALIAPADGDVRSEGEIIDLEAEVSDAEDPPEALTVRWESDLDGELDEGPADEGGSAGFSTGTLSLGAHTLTATVTDLLGAETSLTFELTINALPSAPSVIIEPGSPLTADDLTAVVTVEAEDPEGGALTYTYQWFVDGLPSGDTAATLPASATARGEVWSVWVRAFDSHGASSLGEASAVIGNTAPEAGGVTLSPGSPTTEDTLAASASGSDEDGDPVSFTYDWYVDGALATSTTDPTLSGLSWFDRGQEVYVVATPDDGTDAGAPATSAAVTVANSPPAAPQISLTPEALGESDLLCQVDVPSSDADGDSVTYTMTWTVDGAAYPGGFADAAGPADADWPGDTVPLADTDLGEDWVCTATPNDGFEDGASATASFTGPCSALTVAHLPGWGGGYIHTSLAWTSLLANQASYGACTLSFVQVSAGFTLSTLIATGAEVLVVGDVAGAPLQYTAAEIAAIEDFVKGGYGGILATFVLYHDVYDNSALAALAGVDPAALISTSAVISSTTLAVLDAGHPLASGLGASFTAGGYTEEQGVAGAWSSALLAGASVVMEGSGSAPAVIAYEGSTWNGAWYTWMPEYADTTADGERMLYNGLVWAAGYRP